MKRLSTIMMCLLAMMAASLSAKAQEVTITLFPGWNWISYPKAEVLDINTALGDFVPVDGDMLKSQFGNAVYSNGYWRGSVTHFIPGWGYKYYSNRTEVVSFVFGEAVPQLIVTTAEPTEITAISAISGGSLTSSDGSYIVVLEKGICWATHPNPTVMNDFHTENGGGINSFTAEMTGLNSGMVYYVRAFAVISTGTIYGDELSFCTDHEYVDLGLPSGLLWATCNVGANTPEDYGDYFAWGETRPKDFYDWSTYKYCYDGDDHQLTKYCSNSSYGYNGFRDYLNTLLPEDDAATTNWGTDWRMPTSWEWQELYQNTTCTWITQNGVNGRLFIASNGNSLFLPAAGSRYESSLYLVDYTGRYWSSTLYTQYPSSALYYCFISDPDYNYIPGDGSRCTGRSVRAVRPSTQK